MVKKVKETKAEAPKAKAPEGENPVKKKKKII